MQNKGNIAAILLFVLLGAASLLQIYHSLYDYARYLRAPIWRMRDSTSFERSAYLYLGDRARDYMNFLDALLPSKSSILVIPNNGAFSQQNILQFYLGVNRAAVTCDLQKVRWEDCIRQPQSFVPAIGNFPPESSVGDKGFFPYVQNDNGYRGVYTPPGYIPPPQSSRQGKGVPLVAAFFLDLGVVLAVGLIGILLAWLLFKRLNLGDSLILAIPLGTGLLTWIVFLICWAGVPFTLPLVAVTYLAILAILGGAHFWQKWQRFPAMRMDLEPFRLPKWPIVLLAAAIAIMAISAVYISIGRGYSIYDDMAIWSLKGYVIADQHSLLAAGQASGHGLAYPLNISLAVAFFRLIDGDVLPGSKLIYIAIIAALFLGCYRFWKRNGSSTALALLGVLTLVSVPVIYQHATSGYANLPFSAYLVLGALWSIEGLIQNRPQTLRIGGLLLAFGGWTRPEGIGFALALGITLLAVQLLRKQKTRGIFGWFFPIVLIPGVWLIFSHAYVGGDQAGGSLQGLQSSLKAGDLGLNAIRTVAAYAAAAFSDVKIWGLFIPALLLAILIALPGALRRPRQALVYLLPIAGMAFLIPVFLFYVESFHEPDFYTFLVYGFDRAFFPAAFLLTSLAVLMAGPAPRPTNIPDQHNA